ncbi:heme-binding protein [Pediococcus siamensis]|uniref:heme-binding protein n=1 Tax=Pediococcus siamensis TaxID=381829 RepID=UPI0039A0D519
MQFLEKIDVSTLEAEERDLVFTKFNDQTALQFVTNVEALVNEHFQRPVAIRVILDHAILVDVMMIGRIDNKWIPRKINTVIATKHSSLSAYTKKISFKGMNDQTKYAICGGGFPLIINHQIRGAFAVSGMKDHLDDHRLIVSAIHEILKSKGEE